MLVEKNKLHTIAPTPIIRKIITTQACTNEKTPAALLQKKSVSNHANDATEAALPLEKSDNSSYRVFCLIVKA